MAGLTVEIITKKLLEQSNCKFCQGLVEKLHCTARDIAVIVCISLYRYRMYSMIYPGVNEERFSVSPMFACNYTVLCPGRINLNDSLYIKHD